MAMQYSSPLKIRVPYVSIWLVTIVPALVFLGTMGLFVYYSISYFNSLEGAENRSAWADLGIGLFNLVGSVVTAIIVVIPTQMLTLAIGRLRKVSLSLDGSILKHRRRKIDLSQPYSSFMGAGVTPNDKILTMIYIKQGKKPFHISLEDMDRTHTLRHFKDELYIRESVLSTEYGNAGYECDPEDTTHSEFMSTLLDVLFENRSINTQYALFESFPWDKNPAPSVSYIREIDEAQSGPFSAQLNELKQNIAVTYGNFSVSGDYVIIEGHLEGKAATFLAPLGHAVATIEELHYVGVTTTSTPLKQKEVCFVHGTDEQGKVIKITVDTMPADTLSDTYLQLDYFFQFMLHMSKKR